MPRRVVRVLQERSLHERLKPRIAVEEYFTRSGHTYRHGPLGRAFEHNIVRPTLKYGLKLAGLYDAGVRNAVSPVVREITLDFDNLPSALDGFELLHISDPHIDGMDGLLEALTPVLRQLNPDVCVITGDYRFEDRGPCDEVYPRMEELLASISARHGVFGIMGNHDAAEIAIGLEEMGVRMLVNDSAELIHDAASLWLLGVDDPFDYRCDDLPAALEDVPPDAFKILLAHAPELYQQAAEENIHLYLSGHTHAGQIRLPLVGSVRHNAKCPRAFSFGQWRYNGMHGYTSSGVGCSGLPIRFNCPPEVVLIRFAANRRR